MSNTYSAVRVNYSDQVHCSKVTVDVHGCEWMSPAGAKEIGSGSHVGRRACHAMEPAP